MNYIEIITFKGCQFSVDLRNQLENLICTKNIEIDVKMTIVQMEKKAAEKGLYGAPTILINGNEYQKERRGPPGFYCRIYLTSNGFGPYPLMDEIVAYIKNRSCDFFNSYGSLTCRYPVLITARWCPFTSSAIKFWMKIGTKLGLKIKAFDACSNEGKRIISTENISGVPCLVASKDVKFYGLYISQHEAEYFLKSSIGQCRSSMSPSTFQPGESDNLFRLRKNG